MNNDLIRRSVLLKDLEYDPAKRAIVQPQSTFGIILSAPAVDAVEVIRCGECMYRDPEDKRCKHHMSNNYFARDDYGFCSYGERRDDGT